MYGIIYLGAVLSALVSVPICLRLAVAMGILDRPGTRKVHSTAIPRIGGLALVVAVLGCVAVLLLTDSRIGQALRDLQLHLLAILGASVFVSMIGLADDAWRLRAREKLVGQFIAALVVCSFGIRMERIAVAGLFELELGWLAWPVTIFWIIAITNAVNLIDGLDGLAAGLSAIACGVLLIFTIATGQVAMAALMVIMLGGLTGFLFFNFNPAKIFLGDCGSMFLGFFLATAGVMSATHVQTLVGMALSVLALGVPIFDTFFSIVRRTLDRRSLFAPDRGHIHHRLIDFGLSHRRAVLVMYAISIMSGLIGLLMLLTAGIWRLCVFGAGLTLLVIAFRRFGAIQFRQAYRSLRRNRTLAREAKQRRQRFEELQLRLREATTMAQWWRIVRRAARYMGFSHVSIEVQNNGNSVSVLTWNLPGPNNNAKAVHMSLPVRHSPIEGELVRANIMIPVNGSLESAGGRMALFGRLIDERSLADLPESAWPELGEYSATNGQVDVELSDDDSRAASKAPDAQDD